ncbi:MAG: replicative DNA helicase [Kiritimatiellae bacterium]|nr:replicative DNA helicase [Kiritimatiellia bacterium]
MAAPDAPALQGRADRVPPHSEDAERGILGSMMLDAARAVDLAIEKQIRAESFYIPAHQKIFQAIVDLHDRGRPVDLTTLGEHMTMTGAIAAIGGMAYLENVMDATPTSAALEYYIEIVRQKFILRRIIEVSRDAAESCYFGSDAADMILDRAEQYLFDISHDQRRTIKPWSEIVRATMVQIEKVFENKSGITGVPTGFADIDRLTGGLQPADMVIIAARPSMGKTSLAMNIAEYVATGRVSDHQERAVAIFSLEMPNDALARRMLCSCAEIGSNRLRKGFLSGDQHRRLVQAAADLERAKIFIDDSAGLDVVELRARARRLKKQYDIQLIVVDYLQLLHCAQRATEGRQLETAAISASLKGMAKELRVPVVVLSQLSRAPETRDRNAVPKLSDLRDSGSIEQDADLVMLLRRPCKYPQDPDFNDKSLAIVELAKHRNGETGIIRLNFHDETTRFSDRRETDQAAGNFQASAADSGEL